MKSRSISHDFLNTKLTHFARKHRVNAMAFESAISLYDLFRTDNKMQKKLRKRYKQLSGYIFASNICLMSLG